MILIIDTSVLIELQKGNKTVIDRLSELKNLYPAPPKISFMAYFEYMYGLRKKSIKNKIKALSYIDLFEVIQTTNATAETLSELKTVYELSLTDLFIAAQVIEEKGILVTMDNDFKIIKEIQSIILSFD